MISRKKKTTESKEPFVPTAKVFPEKHILASPNNREPAADMKDPTKSSFFKSSHISFLLNVLTIQEQLKIEGF